ncbi:MAG: pYEATS domain-containing protein [Bryobacteraceae bacterium]
MFTKERVGGALFTLLCLGIAVLDYFREKPLHPEFLALLFLAAAPWALPWLATLVKSLKVGGMDLSFREMQAQIEENREVINATASAVVGVGKAPGTTPAPTAFDSGAVSHDVVAADDEGPANPAAAAADPDDPNFSRFGNKPVAGGRRLSATVKPFPGSADLFMIHASVTSTDAAQPLRDGTKVRFHLHPTFRPPEVTVEAVDGAAAIDRVAWGWFTVGAEVDGQRLGLPLNTVRGAPELFKSR